jgi:lambda repressor-like predicted transcriptional regulator
VRTLDFVFRQSYGKSITTADERSARDGVGVEGRERRALARGVTASLREAPYPLTSVRAGSGPGPSAPVDALLAGALGVQRHEPCNPYNPHGAIPSARSAFAATAFAVEGGSVWRYLPFRHEVERVGAVPLAAGAQDRSGVVHVCLVARYAAIPSGYGELRYALSVLEAGHAVANLVMVGMALGLHSRVDLAFVDDGLLELLRLDARDGWIPCAVVTFAPDADGARTAPLPFGAVVRVTASPAAEDEVASVDRAGWIDGPALGEWSPRRGLTPAVVEGDGDDAEDASGHDLATVLWRRSSGRGPRGLSASFASVPSVALRRAAREGARRDLLWGSVASDGVSAGLRFVWVTERVDGVVDGIHSYDRRTGRLETVREGRFFARLQDGFSYPPTATAITTMNVVGFAVADHPAIVAALGPRGWRLANLEMGAAMQAASLAFASAGMFARPCRSFHEYVLDDVLGVDPSETVGYELIAGVDRFSDLSLDLRL